MKKYKVISDDASQRIDKIVCREFDLSRSLVKELIENGNILVNDESVKSSYKVKEDDELSVVIPEPKELEIIPVNLNLDIVYEDKDVLVVNKPEGMVVHPSTTTKENTLVHGLMYQVKDLSGINGVLRPGIVHRIDKDTTGLLMVAKNDEAHEGLVTQLQNKTVVRYYIALVYGVVEPNFGKITAPIGRDPNDRIKMAVNRDGKDAVTHFEVLERFADMTLVKCRLETGRTHQIRVHLKYIGHTLVGDKTYGPKKVVGEKGQYLHAHTLGFTHPITKKKHLFTQEIPDYFEEYLKELRG
ncbi:MAG: RluA family pseudouridine synthase [bacterium]